MKKTIQMKMEGYEIIEKVAMLTGNGARIYVPKNWAGKKIRAVLIEQ